MKTEQLAAFLSSFSESIDADNIKLYTEILKTNKMPKFDDYEEFYLAVIFPFENFLHGFIQGEISANDDVVFLIKNSQFIEGHFKTLIERKEGAACCADKSRTIMKRLIKFYTTGDQIVFDYDAEYTYHLPKTIFKEHAHIILFYEGLRSLFHGEPEKYLEALKFIFGV